MSGRAKSSWRIAALVVVALLAVALLYRLVPSSDPARAAALPPAWGPPSYSEALAALTRDVERERRRVEADPGSWMRREALAVALHGRGQLTGSHEDLAEAVKASNLSRELAPGQSGPVLARAVVSLSLHRNAVAGDEVERMARFAVPPADPDRAEAEAIMGDIALYQGDYPEALARYRAADGLQRSPGTLMRLSDWHRHMGRFDEAREFLEAGLADGGGLTPWTTASFLLQIGAIELQSGDWQAAEQRFLEAERAFPGWWLAKAHMAQMAAVRGDLVAAEALYREALAGTERPSVMEALAAVLEQRDEIGEAKRLTAKADELWFARVAEFPEAYADHAFEAALRANDLARAKQFASLNFRTRPYGDGQIGFARALAARREHARARALLDDLARTGWRSTEQFRVLAEVCERLKDMRCVERATDAALDISPRAFDERSDLLFFGNH